MRPIDKGKPNKTYKDYQNARNDLCRVIGWYCSYCEMPIRNMPEVEHVIPIAHNGPPLDWGNFLLSCKYCNVNKKANNMTRTSYYWPDQDNTFRAFRYRKGFPLEPSQSLNSNESFVAQNTITLCGLDREPDAQNIPTERDTRWRSRLEAWEIAVESLTDWEASEQTPQMAKQIARTAKAQGHFSIWMEVFKDHIQIRKKLLSAFLGTDGSSFDKDTNPVKRLGGNL